MRQEGGKAIGMQLEVFKFFREREAVHDKFVEKAINHPCM